MRADLPCPTWADHDFGSARFVEAGRDLLRGRYERYERRCVRCGRTVVETRWTTLRDRIVPATAWLGQLSDT